jgi:tetratricopeptide (TPR) repeat protein
MSLPAQTTPVERLTQAYAVEREGKPAAAIPELQHLLNSRLLDEASTGKAWNILGNAYQDEEDFADARHAYEQSVQIYETTVANKPGDRAGVLDDFGQLYVSTRQFEVAARLETKALQLYEQVGDHAGMARAASHLAGTAFSQGNVSHGSKFLKRATKEAKLANNLDDDDRAAIESLRGWQAQLNDNLAMSITSYGRALAFAKKRHGEEHPATGWSYVLLGNADAAAGNWTDAVADMRKGLAILDRTMGRQSQHYLIAEIAYARALDGAGYRVEAAKIRTEAEPLLKERSREQCDGCTVTAAAFR